MESSTRQIPQQGLSGLWWIAAPCPCPKGCNQFMSPSCCVRGADVLQWSPVKTKPHRGHFSLSQRRIVSNEINDWPVHPVSLCHNQQTTINNGLTQCHQQGPIAPCETFPRFGTPHLVCRCYSLEWLLYQRTSLVDVLLSWMDQKSFFGCGGCSVQAEGVVDFLKSQELSSKDSLCIADNSFQGSAAGVSC